MHTKPPDPRETARREANAIVRNREVQLFHQPLDGSDMAFWNACHQFESNLANGLAALAPRVTLDGLVNLFTRPWPEGLRKDGLRLHPKQDLIGYTLMTFITLPDEGRLLRWRRSANPELKWPDTPEEFRFPPLA